MKKYIRAGRNEDDALARQYVQMIKDALIGYEDVESDVSGFPISIVDVIDVTYSIRIADRPPYTKYIALSGYALTSDSYDEADSFCKKQMNYFANDIRELLEDTIPNSACTKPTLYGDAIKFNVTAIID